MSMLDPSPTTSKEVPVRTEPLNRRLRVLFNGQFVADTTSAVYVFEQGHLPIYYIPMADVRADVLRTSRTSTHCPRKGDAVYWSVEVGNRRAEDAVWGYPTPFPQVSELANYVAFGWDKMDGWFEEDEEVFVHARDPYHRVDVLQSSRHVEVSLDGVVLADTHRPHLLFETSLPTRYYIPKVDVQLDRLRSSSTTTSCPYKGTAAYFDVATSEDPSADGVAHDIVWFYPAPLPEIPKIENLLCFFNEKVDITVDGVLQPRPQTHWS